MRDTTRPRPSPGGVLPWIVLVAAGLILPPGPYLRPAPPEKVEAVRARGGPPAPQARAADPADETETALADIRREAERKKAERADQKRLRQKAARLNRRPSSPLGPARVITRGRRVEMFGEMLNQQRIAPMPDLPWLGPGPMRRFAAPVPGGGFAGPGPPQVRTFRGPNGGVFLVRW